MQQFSGLINRSGSLARCSFSCLSTEPPPSAGYPHLFTATWGGDVMEFVRYIADIRDRYLSPPGSSARRRNTVHRRQTTQVAIYRVFVRAPPPRRTHTFSSSGARGIFHRRFKACISLLANNLHVWRGSKRTQFHIQRFHSASTAHGIMLLM